MRGRLRRHAFAWLMSALIFACLFSYALLSAKGVDEASPSVGDADVAVRQAFNATLDAEKAGANVFGLIARLNDAGSFLGEAEMALANGNLSEAANEARQCFGIAQGVKSDADGLKSARAALNEEPAVFWMSLTFSLVSIAVFVVVLVIVWSRFKHGYNKKTLGMKPEVASDGS